ncbi:MAG: CHAT domain-containing protein, partial [Acidobacteria bacterium]|nr:CHAT domain-containing protein [Acidobacteriota bacterium]
MPDCTITLSIKEFGETGAAEARGFLFHVLVDGQPVASNQSLSPDQAKQLRQLSQQFNNLFESHHLPNVANDNLRVIGAELFNLWLAASWDRISAALPAGANRTLLIASEAADVLNLPWELLRLPDKDFIAFDQNFNLRRLPRAENTLPKFDGDLPAGPLRVLFAACSPLDEAALDYEKEEESLIRVMAKAGSNVVVDSGDMGSYDELRERLNQFDPHVVYLTGHGIVKADGLGYFCFEDERGNSDLRSSKELRQLFAGSSVQCVFVSGCQTGKAPPISALGGICQGLVSEEVPFAIGWAASIADSVATEFATQFFRTLAAGQPIGRAMNQARQAIRKMCDDMGYPAWTLPVLYAATSQTQLFDPNRHEKARRPNLRLQPLPGMIEGYAEHFVGRRREIQRLLPALREGSKQVVLLTGIGGAGKSTLATRLARKLEGDGFTPIAISSTDTNPLTGAQMLQSCGDAFLKAGLNEAFATLNNPQIPMDARLRFVVGVLNEHRFVLVLDNFEVNLDETTRRAINPEVAEIYSHLLANLIGDSRAFITCRYLPADARLPKTAHEEALGDFPEAQFVKLLLREPELEKRYYAGDLPKKLLQQLHELLGGTPRFLLQMREAI